VTATTSKAVSYPVQFDVYLVSFDPVQGSEISKTRPAVIVSPNAGNRHLKTVIVAPLTSTQHKWPTRVAVSFSGKTGDVALDQLRSVDKKRLIRRLGKMQAHQVLAISDGLLKMFALENG
jgi:mRNA interferase MazF